MQTRVSRFLLSNLYRHLSLPSPPTAHLSSIPNRPSRRDRRGDDGSEDHFLRSLDFGDDGDVLKENKSDRNPPSQIPNRALRGEKKSEPLRGSDDRFPHLSSGSERRTRRTSPARNSNRPMRGVQRDEDVRFQPKIREGEEVYGKDFGVSRRNEPPQFANRQTRAEERNNGSSKVADSHEDPTNRGEGVNQSGDSFRNLKFGEVRTGEKVEETNPNAQTQIAGADPAVSESSTKDAEEIFKKMKETGLIPNAVAMLDGLCKDGLVQEAMKLFGLMREKGSIPEVVVYTAVVEGFCKAEKFDDAIRVFRKMQKNGITPNAFSYTVLIRGLCSGRKLEDSVEFCMEMLGAGHSPNAATFIGLVEGFCTERGTVEAENVIKDLRERGFVVDEKVINEHLDRKGPFSPMVRVAIFGKKSSHTPL